MITEADIAFMRRAIELAGKGAGWVNPNPLVGAMVVREGRIIGQGWHERCGGPHAERNAFAACRESARGATLYVTLEPCCHHGKTPPCTDAVIEEGIARVVVGIADPNPLVAGQGIARLREAGIEVECGVCGEEIRHLNRVFLKYITTRMPWVTFKTAMTLDGKIATHTGDSRWVTGEPARALVQELRQLHPAILAGSGTVAADNPMLNCRLPGNVRQPVRIVADSRASMAPDANLVTTAKRYPTLLAHTPDAPAKRLRALAEQGVELLACPAREGHVDCAAMLRALGERGIDALLLEGGGGLAASFMEERLIDEVYAFIAPKFVGGRDAKTPIEGTGFCRMAEALALHHTEVQRVGDDILVHGLIQ